MTDIASLPFSQSTYHKLSIKSSPIIPRISSRRTPGCMSLPYSDARYASRRRSDPAPEEMRAMGSSRIAILIDDESQRKRFAEHAGAGARLHEASGGDELTRLAAARSLDVVIVGVLNRNDEFLASTLRELGRTAPEIAIVGVFEPSRPLLDEAADLAREIPGMGFSAAPALGSII